jgi:hypothetical protein
MTRPALAFERSKVITFPEPIGVRRAYTMPFTDQLYYPATLGVKTAIARIALDPPWLGLALAIFLRAGLRRALARKGGARGTVHALIEKLRARYAKDDRFALVVDVRGGDRSIRTTLHGHRQADATAAGAFAIAEALFTGEVDAAGVWLAEQVIEPKRFVDRLAAQGFFAKSELPRAVTKLHLSRSSLSTLKHGRIGRPRLAADEEHGSWGDAARSG